MSPPVEAVLFDFGGVITTSPFEAFARYERDHGLPEGFIRLVNSTDHHENAWARLERSELSLEEFDGAFADDSAALGHRVEGRDVLALLAGDLRHSMITAVKLVHTELKTGLLTNNFVLDRADTNRADTDRSDENTDDGFQGSLSAVLAEFDVVVESSRIGVRKPEARFYEIACELLEIEPSRAVFLDDLGVNLKPARAMGMHTIKVEDPAVAISQLEDLVGFSLGG